MTDNVIPLPQQEELVRVCECGCVSFRLVFPKGELECCECDARQSLTDLADIEDWRIRLPDPEKRPTQTDKGTYFLTDMNSPEASKLSFRRKVDKGLADGTFVFCAVVKADGGFKVWGEDGCEELAAFEIKEVLNFLRETIVSNDR